MAIHRLPEVDGKVHLEYVNPKVAFIRHEFVPKVPVGTYVAMVFRVTEHQQDADGSCMYAIEAVEMDGSPTGWEQDCIGLYENSSVVLDTPADLHTLIQEDQ